MIRILFICHGNICRSPMAEYIMKQLVHRKKTACTFEIASSATSREEIGNDMHPGARLKLQQEGIPFAPRQAVQLTKQDYGQYDLLIAMDNENLYYISKIIGEDTEHKVHLLLEYAPHEYTHGRTEVADPWYTGNFETTFDDILTGCTGLLDSLLH